MILCLDMVGSVEAKPVSFSQRCAPFLCETNIFDPTPMNILIYAVNTVKGIAIM